MPTSLASLANRITPHYQRIPRRRAPANLIIQVHVFYYPRKSHHYPAVFRPVRVRLSARGQLTASAFYATRRIAQGVWSKFLTAIRFPV